MLKKNWPFGLALVHTLILACYAFPAELVPERLRYWSSTYTKPVFHQQWNLFAPDVPPCGCTIEAFDGEWKDLMQARNGILWRRLVKWGCRSMSNYRDPLPSNENNISWPGMAGYAAGMAGQGLDIRVKRSCYSERGRVVHIDTLYLH